MLIVCPAKELLKELMKLSYFSTVGKNIYLVIIIMLNQVKSVF